MSAYDTHQRLRTKAIRQLKKKAYDDAIKTIGDGSVQMLEAKEQGSGCDLAVYLVDIYSQSGKPCDEESRKRLVQIISLAANDFWRKKVIEAAIKWSVQASRNPAGDSQLRLAIADVLAKEGSYFAAEGHFIAACVAPPAGSSAHVPEHAPKSFALMMIEWLGSFAQEVTKQEGESREAAVVERTESGRFALRAVLPLLGLKAPDAAKGFLSIFISRLMTKHPSLLLPMNPNPRPYTTPAGADSASSPAPPPPKGLQLYVTGNPDLNFAQMGLALTLHAISSVSSGSSRVPEGLKQAWISLVRQYEREGGEAVHEPGTGDAINSVSTSYFQLQAQRPQGNFMQDMLSSLMGGGGSQPGQGRIAGGAGGEEAEKVQALAIKQAPEPEAKQAQGGGEGEEQEGAIEAPEEEDLD